MALEVNAARIILDDKQARRTAAQFQLPVTGTVGIVLQAKSVGLIPLAAPVFTDLVQAGFRLSTALLNAALKKAGE
ncbi:MAG: DUF3368 domain-containing protein [Gemmataceae bacterium]|nr:DUF3368 domain-containing protein [Gemmataceae bacterium]